MTEPLALRSAQSFLGTIGEDLVRCDRNLESVPHNELGLRCLAADNNWSAVAQLAKQLGAAIEGETLEALSSKLRFILVEVTANFHMQRYNVAKKLVESLGDLSCDRYLDPRTGESVVPFSLRFISALIPSYTGERADSQLRLYALLEECKRNAGEKRKAVSDARIKRVQRALAVSHCQEEQYTEALRVFKEAITEERNLIGGEADSHSVLRHMLYLRQFAALALYCGDASLANAIYGSLASINISGVATAVQKFHGCLVEFCRGIWLSFNGNVQDSVGVFRDVTARTREHYRDLGMAEDLHADASTLSNRQLRRTDEGRGDAALLELCRHALHQLVVNAATSHIVATPYDVLHGRVPAATLGNTIRTMEGYLRSDPVGFLSSDAFLLNSVRFYALEGNTQLRRVELLKDLMEVFRCDRASAPPVDRVT